MWKLSARDAGLIIGSLALGSALALASRLPAVPDENNLLGLIGSLVGAAVAVIAGLIILARQFETADERHIKTIRQLLEVLKLRGATMQLADAALDPAKHVKNAFSALCAAKSVTRELQASGPHMAAVAQLLHESDVSGQLIRLNQAGIGIATPDLMARGSEITALADEALRQLASGL